MVGTACQSGAPRRIRPRRSAMRIPIRKPPPRTITDASAAPSTPSRANGPTPRISSGSRATLGAGGAPPAGGAGADREDPTSPHPGERQKDQAEKPRRRHRGEPSGTDQPAHPQAIDDVEGEVTRHHRHGGGGEAQNHGPQRPDGERALGTCSGRHGAWRVGGGSGTSVRKRQNTGLSG